MGAGCEQGESPKGMDVRFEATTHPHLRYIPPDALPRMCEDTKGITAITKDGPIATCLFDTWSPNSCHIHIWIGNPMAIRHGFLQEIFGFVFGEESGRELVIGVTPSDNPKALKFNKHVGMKEVSRIPDAFSVGGDAIVTTMTKNECRWIDHGIKKSKNA